MATAPALMTMEQYLKTSLKPDAHFVDGMIEERVAGYFDHSHMLGLVATALDGISEDHFSCLILRLQVSPTCVRVCDVVLLEVDAPDEQIPSFPPTVCVEVLDPTERPDTALPVLADYARMGVQNIWLIDIAASTGFRYEEGLLRPAVDQELRSLDGKLKLPLRPLFEALKD